MITGMEREELVEQAYFFRVFRERLADNLAQEALDYLHQEMLTTTRLPVAVRFLSTELKHTGLLSSGFARLTHYYFTPFQAFVVQQAEQEGRRFTVPTALLVLERMAAYLADKPTRPGLFVFQFETVSRNRLGYDEGLAAMSGDPFYDDDWKKYLEMVRRQVGTVDFADLVYVRSELYIADHRRLDPDYEPPVPALFGIKEGRIAVASRGRDPLYLFAALQRQLGYPEVPRFRERDDLTAKLAVMQTKFRELEARLKLVESEQRGHVDLSQFGKPELLKDEGEE